MAKLYQVIQPFRWATRDYVPGDLIELRVRSHLRHPAIAGKVVPVGDLKGQGVPEGRQQRKRDKLK